MEFFRSPDWLSRAGQARIATGENALLHKIQTVQEVLVEMFRYVHGKEHMDAVKKIDGSASVRGDGCTA